MSLDPIWYYLHHMGSDIHVYIYFVDSHQMIDIQWYNFGLSSRWKNGIEQKISEPDKQTKRLLGRAHNICFSYNDGIHVILL